jgi:hypothetical protein
MILVEAQKTRILIGMWTKKDCTHEVSDRNKDSIENWSRRHSYHIVAKKKKKKTSFIFCPSPETLWEAEFKCDGLVNLAKGNLKQPSSHAMA